MGVEIGLFVALHTYGRQLNQHPHIHLSVTCGGLCRKHGVWRSIFFKKKVVERYCRQAVTALLRQHYTLLNLPGTGYRHIRDYREWCQFLESKMVFNSAEAGIKADKLLEMRRQEFKNQRWLLYAAYGRGA